MRVARIETPTGLKFAVLDAGFARLFDGAPWLGARLGDERIAWSEGDLRCPVAPSKILCIGRNYAAHAKELGNEIPAEPLLFLKPPSSLIGPGDAIRLPPESTRVEHEAELGVVIGKRCKSVSRDHALSHVFGFTCLGDITARDLQRKDVQFTRAKSFDTFCPVGPWIETERDSSKLAVRCRVNGATKQDGTTSNMIFDVPTIVAYASRMMTLEPGDLIATGTPDGVGPLVDGDLLEIDIDGIGVLSARVER
jgi:2-keto-4-pentenoate hydratase/2-oxohepta-3-ene-1,7-dioic acid hydratase in catechol pathway